MLVLVTSMGLELGHELCLVMGHTAKIVSLEDVPHVTESRSQVLF